jgi:hypothetical protein
MPVGYKAIELAGAVDADHRLQIDTRLPDVAAGVVRVLVLIPETNEPTEVEWLQAAVASPAFDYLRDGAEDVYSLTDGKPFHDKG